MIDYEHKCRVFQERYYSSSEVHIPTKKWYAQCMTSWTTVAKVATWEEAIERAIRHKHFPDTIIIHK